MVVPRSEETATTAAMNAGLPPRPPPARNEANQNHGTVQHADSMERRLDGMQKLIDSMEKRDRDERAHARNMYEWTTRTVETMRRELEDLQRKMADVQGQRRRRRYY